MKQFRFRLKDDGMDKVISHNETWVYRMRQWARIISDLHGEVSADDIRRIAHWEDDEPDHPNAWGSLFKPREWRCIGRKQSEWASCHGREIKVWRWMKWN